MLAVAAKGKRTPLDFAGLVRDRRTWHCNRMETGSEEGDLPDRDFWNNIMVRSQLHTRRILCTHTKFRVDAANRSVKS